MKITVKKLKSITIRQQITSRGGGVEIDLTSLGFEGEKMSAYQNYLGGGMLGRICSNDTIRHTNDTRKELMYSSMFEQLDDIAEALRKYFHSMTNPEGEWEGMSYDDNQLMRASVY